MEISFIKMHGVGNDYIYLDLIKNRYDIDFSALARSAAPRHFGIGGDGLVLVMESDSADFRMRMFNADGSEAEMCGNAIRCVGKYLYDSGYVRKDNFTIETLAGVKGLTITERDREGKAFRLMVDMGEPVLEASRIPVEADMNPVIGLEVMGYRGTALSMGNPHFVITVDAISDDHVLRDGPKIETTDVFPEKTNVEFMQVLQPNSIVMRVWERGSGETLACGTGACACAVAGVLNGDTSRNVSVRLLGGTLDIEWREDDNRVYMTGPAVEVYRGVYDFTSQ